MSVCRGCHKEFKEVVKICETCGSDIKPTNHLDHLAVSLSNSKSKVDYWDKDFKHLNVPDDYRPYPGVVSVKKRRRVSRRVRQ